MRIILNLKKNVEQNAETYFEKAKKAKRKLEGALEALERSKAKLKKLKEEKIEEEKIELKKEKREKEWYEKFRWFISSEGFLCIGGRDATTNEIIIKKHTDDNDVVFHSDITGSPFFVIKTEGKKPGKATIEETAIATASFSRAWKLGLSIADVFYINPEQVSKTTKAGEYLTKGAFMIYGKKNMVTAELKLAIGIKEDKVMGGPINAIKKHCEKFVEIKQGNEKASAAAKKIRHQIGGEIDDIIRALPSGGVSL